MEGRVRAAAKSCRRCLPAAFVILLSACASDPGDDAIARSAQVRGTVTLNGRNLASGTVTFYPQDDRRDRPGPGIAAIDRNGSYWVGNSNLSKPAGLPPGRYKVTVLVMTPNPGGAVGPIASLAVPEIYTSEKTTPLAVDLVAGENNVRLDLIDQRE